VTGLLTTDRLCNACYGAGEQIDYTNGEKMVKCDECEGTGREITPIGKELIAFMREHYGLEPKR
jgi:hypothetical protein